MLEEYQDLWVKGRLVKKGARECAKRYQTIHQFCSQYKRPFTVLDLGAHRGYFSVRLADDFDCTAVAIEHDSGLTAETLLPNGNPRVIHLCRRITQGELEKLAQVEHFDVVLALSFIHHQGVPFEQYLSTLRKLGDHLIIEMAMEPTASGKAFAKGSAPPADGAVLAENPAHFGTLGPRPMVHIATPKERTTKPFWGCQNLPCAGYPVHSTFEEKRRKFRDKGTWIRGINLRTYDQLNGIYPDKSVILNYLKKRGMPQEHHDIGPHNVILSGDDAQLIDQGDASRGVPDGRAWKRLIERQDWGVWGSPSN